MRKTFLSWLLVLMISGLVAAILISFHIQSGQALDNGRLLIQLKIEDVKQQLDISSDNLEEIRAESDENALVKAKALAKMLELNPNLVHDQQGLEEIRLLLAVDELHISDRAGILIGGSEESYIGYDYASDQQSAAFLPAITDQNFCLVQDPQPKGINKEIFQYAGVARLDAPGIVQIGYRPEKLWRAMQVADIKNLAPGFRVGKSGSMIIADKEGLIVSIGDRRYLGRELKEYGLDFDGPGDAGNSSFVSLNGKKTLVAQERYRGYRIIGQLPAAEMFVNRNSTMALITIFNCLMFATIYVLIARLVQKNVIDGIYQVNESLSKITLGDLTEIVSVTINEEFRSLSRGLNTMVDALKATIKEVETRIDSELAFARAIQLSALPLAIMEAQGNQRFDVRAQMYTAKEVGGDFYDYFLIDEDKLAVIMADVSDKGIPAALFMMESKSLLKHYALTKIPVKEILGRVNDSLCENNSSNMFVTAFIGILDLRAGLFTYGNAGHCPPLLSRGKQDYDWLATRRCLVLAGMPGTPYFETETRLEPGDRLFLYTDGVTEAANPRLELYSEERLRQTLNRMGKEMALDDVLSALKEDLDRFADGAEQADDITMLLLEYLGE